MRSRQPASPAQALLAALMGALLFFLLVSIPARTLAQQPPPPEFHVEAVRGTGWNETSPPADGWTPVALPDSWANRWPGFDGVVWYRLTWEQPEQAREAGLLLHYLNMADSFSRG